jgi:hypothetical protein
VVQFAFGLQAPSNIADIFGVWLQQINQKMRPQVCVGVSAFFCLSGCAAMMQFFMRKDYILICRLFLGPLIGRRCGSSFKSKKTDRVWSMHVTFYRLWLWRFALSTCSCHIIGLVCNWSYHFICWYWFFESSFSISRRLGL